jgi:anaerobic selenocysteine-containing dehydrogenase
VNRTVLGTCHHDCPDSCGWVATVDETGRAVSLRGNPEHPYSRGELCPKVNRFLDRVYSPDRVLQPLIRTGAKGTGTFRAATWDEALELVAARVGAVVERFGGEAVLPWGDAGTQGLIQMNSLDRRFFARLGSSRQIDSICGATAGAGVEATLGSRLASDPLMLVHSRLVILWGTNTKLTNRHLWPFIEEARANGAEIVVIDPLRTATAEAADWFVQPLPGTDVALMLGMMHVLVRDGLVDDEFVAAHTVGFPELAERVAAWTPQRTGEVCGLDPEVVERLGVLYGTKTPAFIRTLIGAEHREHGAMFFRTLACLPTITGSWRQRGGGLARSVGSWSSVDVDDSVFDAPQLAHGRARRGLSMNHLGRVLCDTELDPPVGALFVYNGNPAVTLPNGDAVRRGLARDDLFTVVSEQFLTDTARFADVVFPATTQLEQLDVVPAWGHLWLGWNEPAIAPLGASVPNTELWRRLSRAMGFDDPELFETDESLIASALPGVDVDELRRTGFVRLSVPDELMPYADGKFATPSGRAELKSERLGALGHDPLPEWRPSTEGPGSELARKWPLVLMTPKHHVRFLNASYTHLPGHGGREGGPFVELHPDDAAVRGIAEGDRVRVRNDRASLEVVARIGHRGRPGVAVVPFGWQARDYGADAVSTVNSLTNDGATDWGGGAAFFDTLVDVEPV